MGIFKTIQPLIFLLSIPFLLLSNDLVISEINYHSPDDGSDEDLYEFIELYNNSDKDISLEKIGFTSGIKFSFSKNDIIESRKYIVLAINKDAFEDRYGFKPFGVFTGKLNNGGEKVTLKDTVNDETIFSVEYDDKSPWPISADGLGHTLNFKSGDPDDPSNWYASTVLHGTPGKKDNDNQLGHIEINEILSDGDDKDAIELYNNSSSDVDISYWYLTDNKDKPKKFSIPSNTKIKAKSYLVFTEDDFSSSFKLSANGESVFIFSADKEKNLTGYSHGYSFKGIIKNKTFGQHTTSDGRKVFIPLTKPTLGSKNSSPLIGDLSISEIHYHPIDGVGYEYLELVNISHKPLNLFLDGNKKTTYKVSGFDCTLPEGLSLKKDEVILIIQDSISHDTFRKFYNIPSSTKLFSASSKLSNSGEKITVHKPVKVYFDSSAMEEKIVYMEIESITYNDKDPWEDADGNGNSLQKDKTEFFGDDPKNWSSKPPTPNDAVVPISSFSKAIRLSSVKLYKKNIHILRCSKSSSITLYTLSGKKLFTKLFDYSTTINLQKNFININQPLLYRLSSGGNIFRGKIIKTP